MGREAKFRKELSMPGLLAQMRRCFEGVEDEVAGRGLSLADCLMSGWAIFALKYPSLLQFEQDARGLGESAHEPRRENLRRLFGVERAPSDVRASGRGGPKGATCAIQAAFARAQRGGALAGFEWLGGRYLLSVDGTGHFSSSMVHCANCCEKRHKDETTTVLVVNAPAIRLGAATARRSATPLRRIPAVEVEAARCRRSAPFLPS